MQQVIAGVLVGAAAILFGPRLLSDIAVTLRPAGKGLLDFGETAFQTVTSSIADAGNWVSGLVGFEKGTAQDSSPSSAPESESEKKEESFLQEAEKFGKDIAVGLVEEEAISFIKMALIAII
jgi:hypothetical protein